jgi:hypothetical protein
MSAGWMPGYCGFAASVTIPAALTHPAQTDRPATNRRLIMTATYGDTRLAILGARHGLGSTRVISRSDPRTRCGRLSTCVSMAASGQNRRTETRSFSSRTCSGSRSGLGGRGSRIGRKEHHPDRHHVQSLYVELWMMLIHPPMVGPDGPARTDPGRAVGGQTSVPEATPRRRLAARNIRRSSNRPGLLHPTVTVGQAA